MSSDKKILEVGQNLILEWKTANFNRKLSFTKDDLGNITSVFVEQIGEGGFNRQVILDQPAKTGTQKAIIYEPLNTADVIQARKDIVLLDAAIKGHFEKQINRTGSTIVEVNFSKYDYKNKIEHLELNVLTIESYPLTRITIGNHGLGIWGISIAPVKLIATDNKNELHLLWTMEKSVRHSIFQKDDLGNISSVTVIDETPDASGQIVSQSRVYYN